MKKIVYIAIGVLAVLAIVLGIGIYQQKTGLKIQIPVNSQSVVSKPTLLQDSTVLSEEENLVATVSAVGNTFEARAAYRNELEQFAKDATTIEITNCKPSPLVARVKEDTSPYITNNDNVEHALRLGMTDLKVPANGTISVKIGKIDLFTNLNCVGGFQGLWIPQ